MKISHLVLHNFRKFENSRFNFHEQFTVLIGNNGAGKTTVLDALAIALNSYFLGSGIGAGGGSISNADARLILTEKGGQVFAEVREDVYLKASAQIEDNFVNWRRNIGDRGREAKDLVRIGEISRKKVRKGESPNLPLLLFYGAGRLWDVHRKVETEKPNSQLDAYRFCLDPKSDQKAFEKWFKKLTFSKLQKGVESPAIDVVKNAVLECIPGAKDFYHDTEVDQIMINLEREGLVPFNYLSDGFRNMVAMVADIAHRASRLNPHKGLEAAKKTSGIVLIDEIDLHLHPKWQKRVVEDLQRAFPCLQFIVTTHSPFILQSLESGEVIDLDQNVDIERVENLPEWVAAPGPANEFSNRSIEDIIESVMGLNMPQRGQRYQNMYDAAKRYYQVLQQAKEASEQEKERLKNELDQLSAPFSDNVAYHAFLEMERLAAGLGKSKATESE